MELKVFTRIKPQVSGESLSSFLVALAVGLIVMAASASICVYCARSFAELSNYFTLDTKSRLALDSISREARLAEQVQIVSTNRLTLLRGTNQVIFTYEPSNKTLFRQKSGVTDVLLGDCEFLKFEILQRVPDALKGFVILPSSNSNSTRLVQMSWRCSRSILGRPANSSDLQAFQVVLRN